MPIAATRSCEAARAWVRTVRNERPPATLEEYLSGWRQFFDHYAGMAVEWARRNRGYHASIEALAQHHIPPGARVLEVGSGTGDLLAAVRPAHGVGIDLSPKMVALAAAKHPHLQFRHMAAEEMDLGGEVFDYVILSDAVGFLYDIRKVFERLRRHCHQDTRVLIHWTSRLWQPLITVAEAMGLKYPQPTLNWTTPADIANLLRLADMEAVTYSGHILAPKRVPALSRVANRYLAHLPLLRSLCLTNWTVARPLGLARSAAPRVSVICPCRNEAGNIESVARRLPEMGSHVELIFVEGQSSDNTLAECERVKALFPEKDIRVFVQSGKGKGDAVRLGFAKAKGDVLMILDADLSVAPEDLPPFYRALVEGKGEFINGSRLVYAMDPKAMRFLNLAGNKLFATLLTRLLGQPVKDTLCGTKVLWRRHYERLAAQRSHFCDFDPFGDFDLLFGAARMSLKIVEMPVRYHERTYGQTNIKRFSDGWLLLRMCATAARKLLFVGR